MELGLSNNERAQVAAEKGKELRRKGFVDTPDGLLSPIHARLAGYRWDDTIEECYLYLEGKMGQKQRGYYAIPIQEYIVPIDGGDGHRNPGEKFWGPSEQYLNWKKTRHTIKEVIEEKRVVPLLGETIDKKEDIDINKIDF